MNLFFFVSGFEGPSSRYRVLQYLPYLEKAGIKSNAIECPGNGLKGWRKLLPAIKTADLLFIQRKRLPLPLLILLKRLRKPIIYDFDDAVMFRNTFSSNPHSLQRMLRFRYTLKFADLIIAGNAFLKGEAEKYHRDVRILPTPIDRSRYPEKVYTDKGVAVNIGWIGSASTIHYLESYRDVWEEMGSRYGNVFLTIICDTFIESNRIGIVPLRWSSEREVEYLQTLDVGLMPLFDDPWSRGKCGFKLIQYMGAGVPAVCSPVGVNREIVQEGINGLWAETKKEWVEKLSMLIENEPMRRRMGVAGRQYVLERYTVQTCAPKLIEWLREMAR
jgi:glycosyltransferase involved in cell wall biosynthesis